MGMSTSQARFLGLTARKTNVEFEGQQINQQRTTLSNQSANYYNDLLGMAVPVPPSVDDYTKAVYTFEDGALTNQITAMIAQNNGTYTVSYLRTWKDDFSLVSAATSIVTRTTDGANNNYKVGSNTLRKLGEFGDDAIKTTEKTQTVGNKIVIDGISYAVTKKDDGYYIDEKTGDTTEVPLTAEEQKNIGYYSYDAKKDLLVQYQKNGNGTYSPINENGIVDTTTTVTEDKVLPAIYDEKNDKVSWVSQKDDGTLVKKDYKTQERQLTQAEIASITTQKGGDVTIDGDAINDEYLKSLSEDQLKQLLKEEEQYLSLLKQKYGDGDYMVRYVQNTTTGEYEPYFYKLDNLQNANYDANGNSQSNINCYKIGTETKTEEVKAVEGCEIEKDSSGRYINITIKDASGNKITYALTTTTATDQAAYDDAMNQYEYEKYEYDQAIQDINSKIEIIQSEDKNLELRLKQLDTEQDAISTEIDAVQKVIEKNVESSFKTFG